MTGSRNGGAENVRIDITDCVRIAVLYLVRKLKFAIPHLVRIYLVLSKSVRKS